MEDADMWWLKNSVEGAIKTKKVNAFLQVPCQE
jgi:hypothetical protein